MDPTITKVTLIRHGETEWNREERYQGQDDSPLTAWGIQQALATGTFLKKELFDLIYYSDLGRTYHTAELITQSIGLQMIPEVRLRERNLGFAQGLRKADFKTQYPEAERRFTSGDVDFTIPGGESIRQCEARVASWMTDVALCHPGRQILAVTHGLILSYILKRVLGIPLEAPRQFSLLNGSINRFSIREGQWFLESWGEIGHIHPDSRDEL